MNLNFHPSSTQPVEFLLASDPAVIAENGEEAVAEALKSGDRSKLKAPPAAVYVTVRPLTYEERFLLSVRIGERQRSLGSMGNVELHYALLFEGVKAGVAHVTQAKQTHSLEHFLEGLDTLPTENQIDILTEISDEVSRASRLGKVSA